MIWGYAPQLIAEIEKPLVAVADRSEGADALMKRAAYALFHHTHRALEGRIEELVFPRRPLAKRRILVLVGAGNNGGDGLYAAAYLARRGYPVRILPTAEKLHTRGAGVAADAGVEFLEPLADVSACLAEIRAWHPAAIIDAIIGIGAKPPLREPARSLIAGLQTEFARSAEPGISPASRPLLVACDHPSGLDLDTGKRAGAALRADLTVTMGAPKTGMLVGPGSYHIGHLEIQGIGLPVEEMTPGVGLVERADVARLWPRAMHEDHKYSRGVLSILAGSARYPGAGILVTSAALAAGAGFVRYLGSSSSVQALVMGANPEVVLGEGHSQAVVIGSGLDGNDDEHAAEMLRVWQHRGDALAVLDAGALALVGSGIEPNETCVLTPHAGEAATLADHLGIPVTRSEIEANPYEWARRLADLTRATVLLKGATTTIANPNGKVYSVTRGTADLATAGSGDVLAGILGYVLAAHAARATSTLDLGLLAAVGAWLHGQAGRLAAPNPRATGIIAAIPPARAALLRADDTGW